MGQGVDARARGRRTIARRCRTSRPSTSSRRPTATAPSPRACLAAGRHCFVEKPLTVSGRRGARGWRRRPRAAGRVVQVGHIFRFHPVTADAARARSAAGRIGAVRYATGRFSGFKRPRTDVGVTHTDAIHYFDLFAHLLRRARRPASRALQRDFLGRGLDDMSRDHRALRRRAGHRGGQLLRAGHASRVRDRRRARRPRRRLRRRRPSPCTPASTAARRRLGGGRHRQGRAAGARRGAAAARARRRSSRRARGRGPNPVPAEAGVHALEIVEAAARSARLARVRSRSPRSAEAGPPGAPPTEAA